ncbi:hypothetical protein OIE73_24580 [Streptomyces hirsutus]|uniref:Uncharacterized protein n=1 Tax=Streptomyces hirsutus TaxID=35620 RepID=A0ABZ1GR74_9ACTN|nr:hypothetical protein [Streptomyces hirsutus]WSD08589.1 hypothetical protein OIE73_24580 [Streptomyces hirsutus]
MTAPGGCRRRLLLRGPLFAGKGAGRRRGTSWTGHPEQAARTLVWARIGRRRGDASSPAGRASGRAPL